MSLSQDLTLPQGETLRSDQSATATESTSIVVPVAAPQVSSVAPTIVPAKLGWLRTKLIAVAHVRPAVLLSALFLGLAVFAALFPSILAPGDPLADNARHAFYEPGPEHLMGTDENGRDVYTRLVHGARASLFVGFSATVVGLVLGVSVGLIAGLGHRLVDGAFMRAIDVLLAFPDVLLALLIITFWGPGLINALIAIGVAAIPRFARLARAQAQVVRRSGYVEAATALGLSRFHIVIRHILPNSIKPVLVLAFIGIGGTISAGAGLSFLGLGIPPPTPEWGAMLSNGREYLANAWWLTTFPSLALTFTVLSVSTIGREIVRRSEGKTR